MNNIQIPLRLKSSFSRVLHTIQAIGQPTQFNCSQEFLDWRHHLLVNRLRWLVWMMLSTILFICVLNWTVIIPSFNASGDPRLIFNDEKLIKYWQMIITQILGAFLCFILLKHPSTRQHPQRLFLLVSISILLTPQIIASTHREISFSAGDWIVYYAIQAILIPVHWRLHVLSQTIVLGYLSIAVMLGFRDPDVKILGVYLVAGFYTLLLCIVADLGVYFYESSLQREFDLRQQLRVFLHAVSHDLRNPVLGMVMTLKSFVNSSGKNAQIPQELLEQLIIGGNRQVELINSLLEAHSTEIHGIILHRQPVELDKLIHSIITDCQPFFQQAKTTSTQDLPPALPLVNVDPLHLRRVYENLISNALKFNRPGLHLTFGVEIFEAEKTWVRCTVRDNGIGMTPQQCDRLFDLYTRGPNRRQSLSLGLGLYMCRQIITAHDGEIGVISSSGNGSTFWFTLPV
jgi:signal transduction histidine kinase